MNISEEMKLPEIQLEFDDGSEAKPEAEKVAEKANKETEKELEKREDVMDEITNAEAPELELTDAKGKEYKEKEAKVKEIKIHKPKDPDVKDNAKGVKLLPEGVQLQLDESDLVEAPIPADLAKAYKKSRNYKGSNILDSEGHITKPDLQKAEYVEATPAEALKKAKDDGNWDALRLLIDGRLVKIDNAGSGHGMGEYEFRNRNVSKPITKKNGQRVYDTRYMSARSLLEIADKIYITNEDQTPKDSALMAARAENSVSPNFKGYDALRSYDWKDRDQRRGDAERPYILNEPDDFAYKDDYEHVLKRMNALKADYEAGNISKDEYDQRMADYKDDYWYKKGVKNKNRAKDTRARARYYDAETALQKPFNDYERLKNELVYKNVELQGAQDKIDRIKATGSDQTARYKRRVDEVKAYLDSYMEQLAELSMKLRYADENDKEALAKAEQNLQDLDDKYAGLQDEFDKLMRKKEAYEPWGDAVETYTKITEANLTEDFDDLVDSLYPQGLNESRLNDLLAYKKDMIFEMLDLEEDDEKINS